MEASNVKAMREALEKIQKLVTSDRPADEVEIANICRAALSEPPRNCDIYGDYDSICKAWEKSVRTGGLTFGEWTFAQAMEKEGGVE